jgi:hypothetical protein
MAHWGEWGERGEGRLLRQKQANKHPSLTLGFVVPYIFKYSNKTPNQMQQSIVTFIV